MEDCRRSLQDLRVKYDHQMGKINLMYEGISKVCDWMMPRLGESIRVRIGNNTDLDQIVDIIKKTLDVNGLNEEDALLGIYEQAMAKLNFLPADVSAWILKWEADMAHCRDLGLRDARNPRTWWKAFEENLRKSLPQWIEMYNFTPSSEIRHRNLEIEQVVDNLNSWYINGGSRAVSGFGMVAQETATRDPST
ncbi:hypothetical protein BROUX41_005942 [Berkeleyomyces rouxiae]|uniref:uncharacterized protein n=1 Tax=Berkeleyomyces rouxiae TaxID=2035830 RepID=UPI003B7A963E